jgi:hypothetical protein
MRVIKNNHPYKESPVFARHLIVVFSLLAISSTASAQKLDINLGNKSARFIYSSLVGGSNFGRSEMSTGFLYNEDENSLLDIGLQVIDMAGSKTPGLELGVGPKFFYANFNKADTSAAGIALGGAMRLKLASAPRVNFGASAYYAPSITSTLDGNNFFEFGVRVGYELLPTATAYIGFRKIRIGLDKGKGTEDLDKTGMAGLKFSF